MFVLIGFADPAAAKRVEDGFRRCVREEGIHVACTPLTALRNGSSFDRLPDVVVLEAPDLHRDDVTILYGLVHQHRIPVVVLTRDAPDAAPLGMTDRRLVLDREQALADAEGLAAGILEYLDLRRPSSVA